LFYLDGGNGPAFYDSAHGDLRIDSLEIQKKLDVLFGVGSGDPKVLVKDLLEANIPGLEKDLRQMQKELEAEPSLALPYSRPRAPSPTHTRGTECLAGKAEAPANSPAPISR
jgi:hypothetical protein